MIYKHFFRAAFKDTNQRQNSPGLTKHKLLRCIEATILNPNEKNYKLLKNTQVISYFKFTFLAVSRPRSYYCC